jgi:hypothetical protein
MMQGRVPQSGSLSARLIRACPAHAECDFECPERLIEELGELAGFDNRSLIDRLKEGYQQWRHSARTPVKPS